ncbi:MAG: zinc ribbon domain-containing protein [Anaerolineae bacterium]|nr:zinc ribbon domain-containing protein [Anaerolineae bacterium]
MIRCSKCGTLNRDGSRFCNDCGAPLQKTSIRCPMCGTLNPVGNLFCDRCHARLVPLEGVVPPESPAPPQEELPPRVQGISLPIRTRGAEETEEPDEEETLPPWLQGLLEPASSEPSQRTAASAGGSSTGRFAEAPVPAPEPEDASPSSAATLPDWLSGLAPEQDIEFAAEEAQEPLDLDPDALPDWLAGPEPTPEPSASEAPDAEIPQKTQRHEEAPAPLELSPFEDKAELPGESRAGELPDWLQGLASESDASGISATEPDKEETARATSHRDEIEIPSRPLREPPGDKASGQVPDWLAAMEPDGVKEQTYPEPVGSEIPDWLQSISDTETQLLPDEEPFPTQSDLPDWLLGISSDSDTAEDQKPESAPPGQAGVLPAWLSDLGSEMKYQADSPLPGTPEEPVQPLPEWLTEEVEREPPAPEEVPHPMTPQAQLPDWISGMEPVSGEHLSEDQDAPEHLSLFLGDAAEQELPPEMTKSGDTPADWLAAVSGENALTGPGQPQATGGESAELPDWLSGLLDEDDTSSGETAPQGGAWSLRREPAEQQAAPKSSAPPDWLAESLDDSETEAEEEPVVEQEKEEPETPPPELIPGKLPDWVRELGPAPVPGTGPLAPAGEGLEGANVPGWLADLRPPGTAPLDPARVTAEPGEAEEGLVKAEIPDWVQQYRPSGPGDRSAAALDTLTPLPAIVQGPLAGLKGLLPSQPEVDTPSGAVAGVNAPLPQAYLEEAQVWQELLERPHGAERPLSKAREKSHWSIMVLRWIVVLALGLAASVAVLGLLPVKLALPPRQEGIVPLHTTVDALQASDLVLIAVEYGPAEAEEMAHMVEALLDHLMERDVRVVFVSTLPESAGLIQERLDWARNRYAPPDDVLANAGYQPGEANGIAQFLSAFTETDDVDLLLILSARSERLRWWIEQSAVINETRRQANLPPLKIGAGLSAGASPLVMPFFDLDILEGWISGFPGVAAYWETRGLEPREYITRRLDAILLMQWVSAGFLLAGALYSLVAGRKKVA